MTKYEKIAEDVKTSLKNGTGPYASWFDKMLASYGDYKEPSRRNTNPYTGPGLQGFGTNTPYRSDSDVLIADIRKRLEEGGALFGTGYPNFAEIMYKNVFRFYIEVKRYEQERKLAGARNWQSIDKKLADARDQAAKGRRNHINTTFVSLVIAIAQYNAARADAVSNAPREISSGKTTKLPDAAAATTPLSEVQRVAQIVVAASMKGKPSGPKFEVAKVKPPGLR